MRVSALNLGSHGVLPACSRPAAAATAPPRRAARTGSIRAAQLHRGQGIVELLRTPHDAMGEERLVDRVVAALDRLADEYHRFILERPRQYGESYPSRFGR